MEMIAFYALGVAMGLTVAAMYSRFSAGEEPHRFLYWSLGILFVMTFVHWPESRPESNGLCLPPGRTQQASRQCTYAFVQRDVLAEWQDQQDRKNH